jgi:arginase
MELSALRCAGLQNRLARLGHTIYDEGHVAVPSPEKEIAAGLERRYQAVTAVCAELHGRSRHFITAGDFTLLIGGDNTISIGSVAAAAQSERRGIMWIDAHADFNRPETSPRDDSHATP